MTLMIISAAGFGRRITWQEDSVPPPGHMLTFKDAMYETSHNLVLSLIFPLWALRLGTPGMRYFARAFDELGVRFQFPLDCVLAHTVICLNMGCMHAEIPRRDDTGKAGARGQGGEPRSI